MLELFIIEKLDSYKQLQKFFEYIEFFVYFNCNRVLYIDINVFKKRDFNVIIYYFKKDVNLEKL